MYSTFVIQKATDDFVLNSFMQNFIADALDTLQFSSVSCYFSDV